MPEESPTLGAKLGVVAALLLIVASAGLWACLYREPASRTSGLPPSDRLLVLQAGGPAPHRQLPPPPRPRPSPPGRGSATRAPSRTIKAPEPTPSDRYVVRKGECLYLIAQEVYSSVERWREIAAANDIEEPFVIREGQLLRIPR